MISVLSHQRLSSGSRFIAVLSVIIMLSACGSTKPAAKDRGSNGSTKTVKVTPVDKKKKVKEVEWTEGKDETRPPITAPIKKNPTKGEILKEDVYDITYFIPFDALNYANSQTKSDRFVQYYCGMQIAADILEKEGVNLNINVVDEEKRNFDDVLRSSISADTDAIVGPYDRKSLKSAAAMAKDKEIPLVSPWQASSKIAEDNPYYVQLRPNLDEHYYAIFEDIKKNFEVEDVVLVGRQTDTKDIKRMTKLQSMAQDVWGKSDDNLLGEVGLLQDSIDMGETAYDTSIFSREQLIAIIPNWSFKDEAFIYGALSRLSVEKGMTDVIVYGMPIMIESDKINFDHYSALSMRVAKSKFVDERDADVNRFKRDFLSRFGALPSDDAYEGYDNLMYIGRNISKYGKQFQYYLADDTGYYLQAAYNVTPTMKDDGSELGAVDYFENKNIDIIQFKDNRFVRELD